MKAEPSKDLAVSIFVIGSDEVAQRQIAAVGSLLTAHGRPVECLKIVDLSETPDDAVTHDILTVPTIIRTTPPPPVRIIGELTDRGRVWTLLSA